MLFNCSQYVGLKPGTRLLYMIGTMGIEPQTHDLEFNVLTNQPCTTRHDKESYITNLSDLTSLREK